MLFQILYYMVISLIIIGSTHYIYLYLKDNLTVPITRDLVKNPINKYQQIYNVINTKEPQVFNHIEHEINQPNEGETDMKQELMDYLKTLNSENNAASNETVSVPIMNLSDNVNSKQQFPLSSNEMDTFTPY